MDIETLRYFQYIAKYKNVTKAASHFYISQSTLSRQMMALEKELGVTLFIRNNKQLELTPTGQVFSKECDLLIHHLEVVIDKTQSAGRGESGVLRIVSPGNLTPVLPQSLNLFKQEHPDTQYVVESYNFDEITSAILYDIYDVGFTYEFASQENEKIASIPIGMDDFSLVVSSQIVKDPSEEAIADVVRSLPLILPGYVEPPFIKFVMVELQKLTGSKIKNILHVNTTDSALLQVTLGLGYSIVPTSITRTKTDDEQVTYFTLSDVAAKGTIVMLYKKDNPSKLVAGFVETVKALALVDPKDLD